MILLINTCKDNLHYFEFVKPIEKIIKKEKTKFVVRHYSKLNKKILEKAEKIIICGTSLQDNKFLHDLSFFEFIKDFKKPILGICAGMIVVSLLFGSKLKKGQEIGLFKEEFIKEFLGLKGEQKVYYLHNYYTTLPKDFDSYTKGKFPKAIKHRNKEIYAVLFYPEVRHEEIINQFLKI